MARYPFAAPGARPGQMEVALDHANEKVEQDLPLGRFMRFCPANALG